MLAMYYYLAYITVIEQQHQRSQTLFLRLVHEIKDHDVSNQSQLKSLLKKPFLKDVSYQLMAMAPSGQTFIYNYYLSDEDNREHSSLPLPTPLHQDNQYTIDNAKLSGWIDLENGYQIHVNIYHPPATIHWTSLRYWLPLLVAFTLLMIYLVLVLKRRYEWEQLIQYTEGLSLYSKEIYSPPTFTQSNATKEFLRMGHALSRINYHLHKNYRRSQLLTHRLDRLIDHSPLPMLTIKRHGQISFFNQRFEQVFATSFQRGVAYTLTDFITGIDKATHQTLTKLSAQRVTRTLLVKSLEDNQTYQLHIMPWFGEHGQIHGFTALLSNINVFTEQINDAYSQLQRQQTRLTDFEQLWSVMGHELRTPLAGMIGMMELLSSDNLEAEQQETLATLKQSSQAMLTMLNSMLDMAKMDAGKLKIESEMVDILSLCQQVCELMVGNARRKGIELHYFFDPQCPRYLKTDTGRLRQILMNLVGNAIKFTQSGYVALIIEPMMADDSRYVPPSKAHKHYSGVNSASSNALLTSQTYPYNQSHSQTYLASNSSVIAHLSSASAQTSGPLNPAANCPLTNNDQQWLCFSVKDTGIGIEKAEQKKLFSFFNQANDSISRQYGGSGLGLAISNNFAQLLGGYIHLDSTANVGSTFSLCLPRVTPSYQPVYLFNTDLSSTFLVAFVQQEISAHYLSQLCNYLLIPAIFRTSIDDSSIQSVSQQLTNAANANLTTILLIDYELYQQSDTSKLEPLAHYEALPKILVSMMPERGIASQTIEKFDGYLAKPLDVGHLISEISRLSQATWQRHSQASANDAQASLNQFLASLEGGADNLKDNGDIDNNGNVNAKPTVTTPSLPPNDTNKSDIKYDGDSNVISDDAVSNAHSTQPDSPLILVAEDNPMNQKVACKVLEKLGYRSIVAENGAAAIQTLNQYPNEVGLILMDCRMPILDGLSATEQIRADNNNIPIIALTANDTDEDRNACLQAGMNSFLAKPLNKDKLSTVLKQFLHNPNPTN